MLDNGCTIADLITKGDDKKGNGKGQGKGKNKKGPIAKLARDLHKAGVITRQESRVLVKAAR